MVLLPSLRWELPDTLCSAWGTRAGAAESLWDPLPECPSRWVGSGGQISRAKRLVVQNVACS